MRVVKMDRSDVQKRIDAIPWYHEFDFGNGLVARPRTPFVSIHRELWRFIEAQLDTVDFRGKTVLDIGCWDGYWSFYAERRGAKSILATDDRTQNWSNGEGLLLARELYGSSVRVNQEVSVYELASLKEKFDIILFLGVYYHLFDPFLALAQIRHCCHNNSLVLIDGPEALALRPGAALFDFSDRCCELLPTWEALQQTLRAAYFSVASRASLDNCPPPSQPAGRLGWRWRLRLCAQALKGSRSGTQALIRQIEPHPKLSRRVFLKCIPIEGVNEIYAYQPPFGLHRYDSRFQDSVGE
jgi:tRNA (mo5U34)-methyltransferase